ncbi:hypothetical protein [Acinetobacter haemolyticus]|uniref:hypothetical protein n=1 Tax=Acinetobacter haemolyticus TaxID=29430 RepID=UPI001385DF06|nr:hypothetical protein [Acinetobacter haemolyticus]NAS08119.1 hypothetical protein [Acinetobacter haemolyticus]
MNDNKEEKQAFIKWAVRNQYDVSEISTVHGVLFKRQSTTDAWLGWLYSAKAKAEKLEGCVVVPESFEIGHLKDRITELLDERQDLYAQINNEQAVPDTHMLIEKKDIENWYLDESEYMWFEADGIDGYLEDIDIGEVIEVQRKEYVVTNNNPVFAAKPWDDNGNCADTWEFFESKDEAEKAAVHCKTMLEAARGGNE